MAACTCTDIDEKRISDNVLFEEILEALPHARIVDEICNSTRMRQEAIKNLEPDVDLIIVVGGVNSSNTRRLLEMSKICHPNIESVMISDASKLNLSLLQNKNHIVISSGASTPENIIDEVYNKIVNY